MRFLTVLLLISASYGLSAQQVLFDKTIPEQNVPLASRLKNEMRSHYLDSRYVNQSDFLSPQDFFIAITPELVVKSKFVKLYNYPSGSFSYEGRLEGPVRGQVTFSKYNDRTAGMILLEDGKKYMIDQVASNIFTVSLSNEFAFIPQENHSDFIEVSGQTQPNASVTSVCDFNSCSGPSTIDIMVVYTPQAENSWGGAGNTIANITQAITNMNASMSASGINNVTFRLVHTAKVSYTESGSFNTDLTRLAGTSDGYIDNVHALRDQYGADLVSMIIGSPTSSCGIGFLNTNPSAYSSGNAFNVSLYSCVVGNFTMAHECGHNMGLRHDWYVDPSTTPCEHHHGYVNQVALDLGLSSPTSSRWRTIMAYNDRCSVAGFNCTRVNVWSNPNLTYNGDAMGVHGGNPEPSDEAWAYYRMACLVAAFRPEAGGGGGGGEICSTPSSLSASFITTSGATVQWAAVSGAIGYDVDYKLSFSSTWINAASNTPSIAVGLGGLGAASLYDWRVRANCSSGSSGYVQSQFTTESISLPACNAPASLFSSGVTTNSATISWGFVSGAYSYDVEYKASSSGTWITAAFGTTSSSINLGGLSSSTSYDWRVRSNCTGTSSNYSVSSFSTSSSTPPPPSSNCPGPYDVSTNGTIGGAATIPLNNIVNGTISPRNDNDHYRFTISSGGTITVSLTTLPANYNLAVLNSSGIQIAVSQNNGTQSESISLNVSAGTYYARVFPKGNANNASSCYTLTVQTGTASDLIVKNNFAINLFPNPADNQLNVWIEGIEKKADIAVYDMMGKLVMQQAATNTLTQMDIGKLSAGFYMVRVHDGKETRFAKFVKK